MNAKKGGSKISHDVSLTENKIKGKRKISLDIHGTHCKISFGLTKCVQRVYRRRRQKHQQQQKLDEK
jgi:hypothetical protein